MFSSFSSVGILIIDWILPDWIKSAPSIILFPVYIFMMATMGLGLGMIISSMTTKYRDLAVLVTFGVQLWMYATPVVYPASQIGGKLKTLMMLNPVSPIVESFRYAFLGSGSIPWNYLGISVVTTLVVLFVKYFY